MADFKQLLSDIQVETKSCSVGLIYRAIRWTLQEFCQQTHYWQAEIDPITLLPFLDNAPGTYIYTVGVPDGARIITVRDLIMDGNNLLERSANWLEEHYPDWRAASGDPQYFIMLSDRQVRFVPASPDVRPISVTGRVVLEPDKTALTFGDDLIRYEEGLVNGCLARLLVMKNKPWTDGPRASVCATTYQIAVSAAKQDAMRDWSYGPITTQKVAWS